MKLTMSSWKATAGTPGAEQEVVGREHDRPLRWDPNLAAPEVDLCVWWERLLRVLGQLAFVARRRVVADSDLSCYLT